MTADPRVPHLVSLSKRHDIVINLIRTFVRTFVLINHLLGGYADPHGANPRISHSLTRSPLED